MQLSSPLSATAALHSAEDTYREVQAPYTGRRYPPLAKQEIFQPADFSELRSEDVPAYATLYGSHVSNVDTTHIVSALLASEKRHWYSGRGATSSASV